MMLLVRAYRWDLEFDGAGPIQNGELGYIAYLGAPGPLHIGMIDWPEPEDPELIFEHCLVIPR